MENIVPYTYYY